MHHLVWDWNGTLFDDFDLNVAAVAAACAASGGGDVDALLYRRHYTRPITAFYERLLGRPLGEGEWDTLNDCYHAAYGRGLASCALAQGARDALAAAAARGATQSLLSMWEHEDLRRLVARFDLDGCFVLVEGQPAKGPDTKEASLARHLARLRDEVGVEPGDVVAIGDTVDDAAAAEACGIACVLVEGGPHPPDVVAGLGVPLAPSLLDAVDVALAPRPRRPGRQPAGRRGRSGRPG